MQEEAARPPLPPRVHEFVVDVADRGPSSRALGITVVAAFAAAVLLMFAMPKRDPHEVRLQPAIEPVTAQVVSPPSEPVPPVGRIESVAKPSAVMPAAVAASTAPRPERVEPTIRIDEPPARIVEVSRGDPTPEAVGATGRAPIDILVAPQMQPREREPAIVSSVISRDQLAPRPPPPEIAAKFTSE
ncbi:MAG TPA: hypothetical protein VHP37_30880 [Burkholderiales bacterium]|nr:hypothetical protein [Burkholderiales bacterium]